MYEYLCQHPLVTRGKRRETHYFDWRFNHQLGALTDDDDGSAGGADGSAAAATAPRATTAAAHLKYYMNFFHAEALEKHASLVTGESTPSYLFHR
jgi:hypothetical protein